MGNRNLTDAALVAETTKTLGVIPTVNLFGWLVLAGLSGVQNRDDLAHLEWGPSRTTRWRLARDVKRLRDELAALGYEMTPDELAVRMVGIRVPV